MSEDQSSHWLAGGIGGVAILGGIVACMGLKLLGGAVIFGGIAATIGLTTDQTIFLIGTLSGLFLTILVLRYRGVARLRN